MSFGPPQPPSVAVLMALYQGERFVASQLASISAQAGVRWRLVVGDDGSCDGGPRLVRHFADAHPGQVKIETGPGRGAAANFRNLLHAALPQECVAFSDQDDVWYPQKLSRALSFLTVHPAERPAIYCSRVAITTESLDFVRLSRLPSRPPSFRHALVQNLVQGNTLVMNPAAVALMREADGRVGPVVMHDWWIYQMVSGAGGAVIHDAWPSLAYRQHGQNVVGARLGPFSRIASLMRMVRGQHREWSRSNVAALSACADLLTPENRRVLEQFHDLQDGNLMRRLSALRQGGFYRQGRVSQTALWLAASLRRV